MTYPHRVVCLHDDDDFGEFGPALAEREGFEVVSTTDTDEVVDRLRADSPDCVLFSCTDPGEWAPEALRTVRAADTDVPCLLVTPETTVPGELVSHDLTAVVRVGVDADDAERDDADDAERDDARSHGSSALADLISEAVDEYRDAVARERERQRLSTFVSESTDTIAVVGRDRRFEYVSPAVTRLLGYDPDELVGTDGVEPVHPDDRERAKAALERLFDAPDGELSAEVRLRHADGSWVWVENRGRNLLDTPHIGGIVIYTREITDRKRREQRLRRYESIVEGMTDVAYTVDESLVVTYANERALKDAEIPREAVVGRSIRELSEQMLVEASQADRFVAALEEVIAGESDNERLELELDLPGGAVFAELRVTPLRPCDAEERDRPTGAVVISREITDRIEYERALERQNERLDTFSGVVSHDLRGPLSIARGNLELARIDCAEGDLDTVEERLDAIERAHVRMDTLTDDLLTVARQGTRVEDLSVVDLDAIAAESWAFVDDDRATVDIDTGLSVHADESRLRQLFENLFRNSVEHGSTSSRPRADDSVEHGSTTEADDTADDDSRAEPAASVHVRVGALDGDGFFVADDGPGIPPDARETVFEGGYSTKSDGTGFGLMIVREIADAHGWNVTVADGPQGGARFEVGGLQIEST